jgi:hypothetical protein
VKKSPSERGLTVAGRVGEFFTGIDRFCYEATSLLDPRGSV